MNNGVECAQKNMFFCSSVRKKGNIHGYNGKKNTGKALVGLEDYP